MENKGSSELFSQSINDALDHLRAKAVVQKPIILLTPEVKKMIEANVASWREYWLKLEYDFKEVSELLRGVSVAIDDLSTSQLVHNFAFDMKRLSSILASWKPSILNLVARFHLPTHSQFVSDEGRRQELVDIVMQQKIPIYAGLPEILLRKLLDGEIEFDALLLRHSDVIVDHIKKVILPVIDEEDSLYFSDVYRAIQADAFGSAQAFLTLWLDSTLTKIFPDRNDRGKVTNLKSNETVEERLDGWKENIDLITLVFVPILAAYQRFYPDKGDSVPKYYSRHASVHAVSTRQYTKENCIYVLMMAADLAYLVSYTQRVTGRDEEFLRKIVRRLPCGGGNSKIASKSAVDEINRPREGRRNRWKTNPNLEAN